MNVAALLMMAALFGATMSERDWILVSIACGLGVSCGLYYASSVDWYVGLSGVLHGILVYGAVRMISLGARLGWLILAAVAVKVAWEQIAGPLPLSAATAGGDVVVDAHLYGAIAGAAAAVLGLAGRAARQR